MFFVGKSKKKEVVKEKKKSVVKPQKKVENVVVMSEIIKENVMTSEQVCDRCGNDMNLVREAWTSKDFLCPNCGKKVTRT